MEGQAMTARKERLPRCGVITVEPRLHLLLLDENLLIELNPTVCRRLSIHGDFLVTGLFTTGLVEPNRTDLLFLQMTTRS